MDLVGYLLAKNNASPPSPTPQGLDWSLIGYTENDPPAQIDTETIEGYNYAKQIYDNWVPAENLRALYNADTSLIYFPLVDTSIATTTRSMFFGCTNLKYVPLFNTSNSESFQTMFYNCQKLSNIPLLDTSKVTEFAGCFAACYSLTNDDLDNILKMCMGATSYTGTKSLVELGLDKNYYTHNRLAALPSFNDFVNAGWTIGY